MMSVAERDTDQQSPTFIKEAN